MYKVFYNNSVIYIGEELTKDVLNFQIVQVTNKKEMSLFLEDFIKTETPYDYQLIGYKEKNMFEDMKACFQFVEAAGGIVQNNMKEYLFIKRFGTWDLPKGKMKQGECPENAAIREVEEETMVAEIDITAKLPSTYHIYPLKNTFVLKKTHWFSMATESSGELIPQKEEDITEAVWLDKEKSERAIQSSYRSLRENFLSFFQDNAD